MTNRFKELFTWFELNFAPQLDALKASDQVFCYDANPSDQGEVCCNIYHNHPYQEDQGQFAHGAQAIKVGNEIVYHNRVWFGYEDDGFGGKKLEAFISYMEDYRPVVRVFLERPVMSYRTVVVPYVDGLVSNCKPMLVKSPLLT